MEHIASLNNLESAIGDIDYCHCFSVFSDDTDKIHISTWKSKGATYMDCQKAPTTVLFDKDENFHTFGYEAEEMYQELKSKNSHKEWFYFQSFMHQIRCNKVNVTFVT